MFDTTCIVKVSEGTYAIRKGILGFYRYYDLKSIGMWWWKDIRWYQDCLSTDLEEVERVFDRLASKEVVIKSA